MKNKLNQKKMLMGNYETDCSVQYFEHELAYCYEKEGIL